MKQLKPTPTGTLRPLGRFTVSDPDPFPAEEAPTPALNSKQAIMHRVLRVCTMLNLEDLRLVYALALRLCVTKDGGR